MDSPESSTLWLVTQIPKLRAERDSWKRVASERKDGTAKLNQQLDAMRTEMAVLQKQLEDCSCCKFL